MNLSRRELLAWLAAAAALQSGPTGSLRLLVHGRLSDAARSGLDFGVSEAAATAALMGREVELGTSAAGIGGAAGVIAAEPPAPDAIPSDTPVILLRDLPGFGSSCTFRVGLTAGERQAALDRWRRSQTSTPAAAADLRVVEWHASLFRYGASELNDRYRKHAGAGMRSETWLAWFAVKALVDTALRHGAADCGILARIRFDGHKGRPLSFDPSTRMLRQPLYVAAGDKVIGEIV